MRAYFSLRKQEAEEDAQERGRGGPKCPSSRHPRSELIWTEAAAAE